MLCEFRLSCEDRTWQGTLTSSQWVCFNTLTETEMARSLSTNCTTSCQSSSWTQEWAMWRTLCASMMANRTTCSILKSSVNWCCLRRTRTFVTSPRQGASLLTSALPLPSHMRSSRSSLAFSTRRCSFRGSAMTPRDSSQTVKTSSKSGPLRQSLKAIRASQCQTWSTTLSAIVSSLGEKMWRQFSEDVTTMQIVALAMLNSARLPL